METIATADGHLSIICPKMPNEEVKNQIVNIIPEEIKPMVRFLEGPKSTTLNEIKSVLSSNGVNGSIQIKPLKNSRKIILDIKGSAMEDKIEWVKLNIPLKKDGFFYEWSISFNDNTVLTYNSSVEKELELNRNKDRVILNDDITNLKILLETETDFDKILEQL
jgi:hypothetical protein